MVRPRRSHSLPSAAAPGIFTNADGAVVPVSAVSRGSAVTLYITGAGALSPQLATGAAPSSSTATADLPKPTLYTTVTIGGVPAAIEFIGNTAGLVGVVQVNVQVPATLSTGTQPIVVTIGGVSSAPAQLQVTNQAIAQRPEIFLQSVEWAASHPWQRRHPGYHRSRRSLAAVGQRRRSFEANPIHHGNHRRHPGGHRVHGQYRGSGRRGPSERPGACDLSTGTQPIVVTIGGVSSAPAQLQVTN